MFCHKTKKHAINTVLNFIQSKNEHLLVVNQLIKIVIEQIKIVESLYFWLTSKNRDKKRG